MPTNFNPNPITPGSPDVTWETATSDAGAALAGGVGSALRGVGAMIDSYKSAQATALENEGLSGFANEALGMEEQVANYRETLSTLLNAKATAEGEVLAKVQKDIARLKRGEVQGTLSPTQALVEINKRVKEYSVLYPQLSEDFRAAANASRGNIEFIVREYGGVDPEQAYISELIKEAAKNNVTPTEQLFSNRRKAERETADNTAALLATNAQIDAEAVAGAARISAFHYTAGLTDRLVADLKVARDEGKSLMTNEEIDAMIERQKMRWRQKVANDFELPFMNAQGRQMTAAMRESIIAPVDADLESLRVILKGQNLSNQLAFIETQNKIYKEQGELAFRQNMGAFGGLASIMGEKTFGELFTVATGMGAVLAAQPTSADKKATLESLRREAIRTQDYMGLTVTTLMETGQLNGAAMETWGRMMIGALPAEAPTTPLEQATRAQANALTIEGWKRLDPAQKAEFGPNLAKSFTWKEFSDPKKIDIYSTLRDNPQVLKDQTEKFMFSLQPVWESGKPLVYKPGDSSGVPIQYLEQYFGTSGAEQRELKEINKLFDDYLRVFGFSNFVTLLDDLGIQHKIPKEPTYTKKDKPVAQPPEKIGAMLREKEAANEIPSGLLHGIAYAESSFNPTAVGPKLPEGDNALGMFQIRPSAHPDFKDFNNPSKSADYAAGYLKQLKDQFGSWELALMAYNWGPGNLSKFGPEKAPKETREYVQKVMGYARQFS